MIASQPLSIFVVPFMRASSRLTVSALWERGRAARMEEALSAKCVGDTERAIRVTPPPCGYVVHVNVRFLPIADIRLMHVHGFEDVSLMNSAYGPPIGIDWLLLPPLDNEPCT